jgi:hypothetical protein
MVVAMNHFFQHLSQPEYVHVLINPIPIYGLAFGIVALIVGLFLRSRAALLPGLIAILIGAAAAWPVFEFGEESYDRVYSMENTEGEAWLNTHQHRAERLIYIFYALAVIALVAILAPIKWRSAALPLAIVTLIVGLGALGAGGWIAYAGGKIRHKEFRRADEPPPLGPNRKQDSD